MEHVDNGSMKNLVILNAYNITEYAWKELYDGKNSVEYTVEAAAMMPDAAEKAVVASLTGELPAVFTGYRQLCPDSDTPADLIRAMIAGSEGFDNIIYFPADCPLIDVELTEKMYSNHRKYFCEYTFADGYPSGITAEIIKTSILPSLLQLAEKTGKVPDKAESIGRSTIFSLIEKDINAFEIETEISPDDQRLLRIKLFPDTKRNFMQLKSIYGEIVDSRPGEGGRAAAILGTVRNSGGFLRSLPVFFEFETTSVHPQNVSYMPMNGGISAPGSPEISVEDFSAALDKIKAFSDDAVISLSIRNEPSVHSSPAALAEAVLSRPGFQLLIETSGTGWNREQLKQLLGLDQSRITWIIDLDALDSSLYEKLRGKGYKEAYDFSEFLYSEGLSNVWVQAVRMKDNEADNELFYKYWKEKTNNVIIQKYDWCCGRLEQRKVTDLSPVKRLPCWHLKREAAVLSDGRVPLCRDDLDATFICGNIFTEEISEIWSRGEEIYRQHLGEEYPGICRDCDEYYTFNY